MFNRVAFIFYFSTLISSIGSITFNVCLIAFMTKAGFGLEYSTLIIGLQRLIPVLVNGLWGHYTDSFSPKKTVILCEGLAAVSSLILLMLWQGANTSYFWFLIICIGRAVVVTFQTGSRVKLTKILSDNTYNGNSRNAIWFNNATQGATLFAGLLAWLFIKKFNLETAIIFDAVSFLIGGVVVFLMPPEESSSGPNEKAISWHKKFIDYFKYNNRAAKLDLLLALSMMGTVAFMARVAANEKQWIGIFMASYGLAVWISGFLERKIVRKIPSYPFWFMIGICYLCVGFLVKPSIIVLIFFFLKDISFWIIFHRLSSYIQIDSPMKKIGSISAARMSLVVSILAIGEVLVGAWSTIVPIFYDGLFRFILVTGVAFGLFVKKIGMVEDDRPIL